MRADTYNMSISNTTFFLVHWTHQAKRFPSPTVTYGGGTRAGVRSSHELGKIGAVIGYHHTGYLAKMQNRHTKSLECVQPKGGIMFFIEAESLGGEFEAMVPLLSMPFPLFLR